MSVGTDPNSQKLTGVAERVVVAPLRSAEVEAGSEKLLGRGLSIGIVAAAVKP